VSSEYLLEESRPGGVYMHPPHSEEQEKTRPTAGEVEESAEDKTIEEAPKVAESGQSP
jgi:hypothetical protein